jgi:hypothetical protein
MMSIRKTATGEVLPESDQDEQQTPQGIQVTSSQETPWTPQDEQELAAESTED